MRNMFIHLISLLPSFVLLCPIIASTTGVESALVEQQGGEWLKGLVCIDDIHNAARKILNKNALDYFESGADDEFQIKENLDSYKRWIIRPRILRNITGRNLSTSVLGNLISFPIGIPPMGLQKLAHPEGEVALAKAAARMGTIFILSTMSNTAIEDIGIAAPNGQNWFQLYFQKEMKVNINLISRAQQSGFKAIVLTVDNQLIGNRRANLRSPIQLPKNIILANFPVANGTLSSAETLAGMRNNSNPTRDESMTWDIIAWLRNETKLPIVVKGILTPEDAVIAVEYGVDGIVVSNHGGRQLDSVLPPVMALEEIVKAVNGKCEIYMDGGITVGADAFKALALGAKMVFAGRATIWGLAVAGEEGAQKSLQILKDELEQTMGLAGITNVEQINCRHVEKYFC